MSKLLTKFQADPTPANRAALQRYMDKHPMAVCMLAPDQLAFLKAQGLL